MAVGAAAVPAEAHLAVDGHEAGDAEVGGAVNEHALARPRVHLADERLEVRGRRLVEVHRQVAVLHPERRRQPGLVRQAVLRVEEPEVDDRLITGGRDVPKLRLRRLPGRPDALVDRQEVLDVVQTHVAVNVGRSAFFASATASRRWSTMGCCEKAHAAARFGMKRNRLPSSLWRARSMITMPDSSKDCLTRSTSRNGTLISRRKFETMSASAVNATRFRRAP